MRWRGLCYHLIEHKKSHGWDLGSCLSWGVGWGEEEEEGGGVRERESGNRERRGRRQVPSCVPWPRHSSPSLRPTGQDLPSAGCTPTFLPACYPIRPQESLLPGRVGSFKETVANLRRPSGFQEHMWYRRPPGAEAGEILGNDVTWCV